MYCLCKPVFTGLGMKISGLTTFNCISKVILNAIHLPGLKGNMTIYIHYRAYTDLKWISFHCMPNQAMVGNFNVSK